MSKYVVNTATQQLEMLKELGYKSFDELFEKAGVHKQTGQLNIPAGVSEFEALEDMKTKANKNHIFKHVFRGAGSYRHYIPSVVKNIVSRNEFVTAYTPYQAEISQGVLQAIYEYQTVLCELTGMDGCNASVYDGASALAEAVVMCTDRKKKKILISKSVNPEYRETVKTYHQFGDLKIQEVSLNEVTVDDDLAGLVVQYPDFYGNIIDLKRVKELLGETKLIAVCDPIALGLLEAPGNLGADIVVGDGQQLGMPTSFGGPYLGFMCCKEDLIRKLPGRIIGETVDESGKKCYVLTLQAREQHIRREKASSSICSNEALCAFTAAVYLSAVGPQGLYEVANNSFQLAHYLKDQLESIGFKGLNTSEFFNEFTTSCPIDVNTLNSHLMSKDILPGLPLTGNNLLWATTEVNSKEEIDWLIEVIKEVL